MRFPYQSYHIRGIGTTRYVRVHRPVLPVRVIGPTGDDTLLGLTDTGADDTLLPADLIGPFGVVIAPGDQAVIVGIDGGTILVRYGTVDLELPGFRWSARVGFHARFNVILGHVGFLDYFTATFNGQRRHIDANAQRHRTGSDDGRSLRADIATRIHTEFGPSFLAPSRVQAALKMIRDEGISLRSVHHYTGGRSRGSPAGCGATAGRGKNPGPPDQPEPGRGPPPRAPRPGP